MAEQAVIQVILGRLIQFLEDTAASISKLRDEVKMAEDELKRIKCRLQDVESQREKNQSTKNWVDGMRQAACEIEDVLDTFRVDVERHYVENDLMGKAKRYAKKGNEMKDRLKISLSIKTIKERIGQIWKREEVDIPGMEVGVLPKRETLLERRRREACEEEDQQNDVVGLEKEINELKERLVRGETRRCVISVVGQAGVGKTVLARKVYNRAKSHFLCSAWIHMSNLPGTEVLRELCKAVLQLSKDDIQELNEVEMRRRIASKLKEKKYLVVVDDVWTVEAWAAIKGAFPDANTGSRVMITTRHERVAKEAHVQTDPYRPPPLLNQKDRHELFCRNAFPKPPHSCPRVLESLANEIVQRYHSLPLALVAVGRILSRKEPTAQAWEDVLSGLDWELTKGKGEIASILALSFDGLTDDLKHCLLYCCAFPGDSEIRVRRLLRQWIAEGFVQKQGEKRLLEAVAMDYLVELVERNLIQPCKRNSLGQIKSCRVHDVLLQTLVTMAEEQNFFQIHSEAHSSLDLSKCRRLAIHNRLEKTIPSLPLARSFISFEKREAPTSYDRVQNFKLLKVLDLEGARCVKKLPEEIGDLVLLGYLGLRDTSIETLPRSIKHLYNLQTLDLRTSANANLLQSKIPLKNFKAKHLKYMTSLRHLYFGTRRDGVFHAMQVPDDFGAKGALKELQTLSYVKAGGWVEKGLVTMTSLVKLGMQVPKGYRSRSILEAIAKLSELHSLYLQGELEGLLTGAFEKLTKLTLDASCLQDDSFTGLQKLKLLRTLKLTNNAYNGKRLSCSGGGFTKLEVLDLENLDSLEEMIVESEALPALKYMRIASCKSLVKIPQGLGKMASLEELKLIDMESCLVESVQAREGEDWDRIKHIESIIITTSAVENSMLQN